MFALMFAMVKIYESSYTYLPFIYLYILSGTIGTIYHASNPILIQYRPYTVLIFVIINTIVYRFYKSKYIIRSVIHKITWKAACFVIFGILANLTHEMVFEDHHFVSYNHNVSWSILYLIFTFLAGYYFRSTDMLHILHLLFFLVPIKRVWEINLNVFTMLVSISLYMIYSKIGPQNVSNNNLVSLPLIRYFTYLRIQDELILIGVLQLYIEYYQRYLPDMQAAKDIEELISTVDIPTETKTTNQHI